MDKFNDAFDKAHDFSFDGFQFDEPDLNMLVFDEDNYLEHLRMQSAGLAYYGNLMKSAERYLDDLEERYKVRYNELYFECSDILARTGKQNNVRDINALVYCKYEKELTQWRTSITEAKKRKDGMSTFYEGWKAKGFSLNAMTQMITAGLLTPRTTISEEDVENSRRRRMNVAEAHRILNKK